MSNTSDKIRHIRDAISRINKEAYKDLFMLSNSVLSKNPYNNNLFNRYMREEPGKEYPFYAVICKLALYYIKSALYFVMYLIRFFEFSVSGARHGSLSGGDELIVIDTPFLLEDIAKAPAYRDRYFLGLKEILKKRGKEYVYLPLFYSTHNHKVPFELLNALKVLKRFDLPFITEYEMLKFSDIFMIIVFILTYPFHVIRCAEKISRDSDENIAIRYELMDTLDQATFYNYSRYLLGRRMARVPYRDVKVISWYENQPVNKNFYKGLREGAGKSHIKIYGAQLFLYSKNILGIVPDENERYSGSLPDKILANGPYYLPEDAHPAYSVGPSLRYAGLFETQLDGASRDNILVLLPYFIDDARTVLKTLLSSEISSRKILIKAHPATPLSRFRDLLPPNAVIVVDDTFKLFNATKILIAAASGTMIEAASLGIPVVSIKREDGLDLNNPLPEYGKGIIWEHASDAGSLGNQIKALEEMLASHPDKVKEIAARYKEIFFCRPTEGVVVNAFEL